MKALHLYPTTDVDDLAWPDEAEGLNLQSSALNFFTDFKRVKPFVIESTLSALEVKRLMEKERVRLKFIVNEEGHFIGIITADELIDRKIVQKVSEGNRREDIPLTELMKPKSTLKALDYEEVSHASIAQVIDTLKKNGAQHCLVIDHHTHKIRGIFSASDISRKLHLVLTIEESPSLAKIFSVAN